MSSAAECYETSDRTMTLHDSLEGDVGLTRLQCFGPIDKRQEAYARLFHVPMGSDMEWGLLLEVFSFTIVAAGKHLCPKQLRFVLMFCTTSPICSSRLQ